jgi:hypothetical protein
MTSDGKKPAHTAPTSETAKPQTAAPIIVDLGKKSRKDIRRLRKGQEGKLLSRVEETVEHLRESGAITGGAAPIVIVVRQRKKRRGLPKSLGIG